MKTIISFERSTGAGARHGTQYLCPDGQWYFVSESPFSSRVGRKDGFDIWTIGPERGWDFTRPVREYHRSNSGTVRIADGRMLDGPRTEPV